MQWICPITLGPVKVNNLAPHAPPVAEHKQHLRVTLTHNLPAVACTCWQSSFDKASVEDEKNAA
jgi:hypothetical protein